MLTPLHVTPGSLHLSTGVPGNTAANQPFFWLADTAWQLLHSTLPSEASYYLRTRARQGFSAIQTVVLSEFDGIRTASAWGEKPFIDEDPTRPNERYFARLDALIAEAASLDLHVGLVAAWGDKLTAPWGAGPRVFTLDNLLLAESWGRFLGRRYRDTPNVSWLLGGDRPPKMTGLTNDFLQRIAQESGFGPDHDWMPIWRAMAAGLRDGLGRAPLIIFHPQGGPESSSLHLHHEPWLSVHGMQSGHGGGHDQPVWDWIARDTALHDPKPTMDLEPNYEDHPVNPWPTWNPALGYFRDHDVRRQCWRSVFAGACGVTYGHHAVWQFTGARNLPVNFPDRDWIDALDRPGARQLGHLRRFIESRPMADRIGDQTLIVGDAGAAERHIRATGDRRRTWAAWYVPQQDQRFTIDLTGFAGKTLHAWWYDPRSGIGGELGTWSGGGTRELVTPSHGPDWVLTVADAAAGYGLPGLDRWVPQRR